MTNQEIKDNIAKVDAAIASPTTPEALKPKLEAKKKEFEKALSDLESAAVEEKKIEQKEKTVEKAKPVTIPQVKKVAAVKKEIQKEKPLVVEKKTKARKSAKEAAAEVKDILSGMSANVKDFNKGRSQADIARDAAKIALKPGKHISASGKTYYENRPGHTDISPRKHLAKGGKVFLFVKQTFVISPDGENKMKYKGYAYGKTGNFETIAGSVVPFFDRKTSEKVLNDGGYHFKVGEDSIVVKDNQKIELPAAHKSGEKLFSFANLGWTWQIENLKEESDTIEEDEEFDLDELDEPLLWTFTTRFQMEGKFDKNGFKKDMIGSKGGDKIDFEIETVDFEKEKGYTQVEITGSFFSDATYGEDELSDIISEQIAGYNESYIGQNGQMLSTVVNTRYEKGGKTQSVTLYDIVWTTDNQISTENLTEQELIEFADTLVYYDTMDEAEEAGREKITTLDAAIKAIEKDNDYKVVKKGNSFAKGGRVVKGGPITASKVKDLAIAFTKELRTEISAEDMDAIVAENKERNDNTCATHDYVDSNMSMNDAFEKSTGRDYTFYNGDDPKTEKQNELDDALMQAAWSFAKANDFDVAKIKTADASDYFAAGGRTKAAINKDRKYINQSQSWETDYERKQPGRHYMATGGEIPVHFGTGTNITVFGYETKNFGNCPRAVEEIVKARNYITAETSGTKYEEQSEGLKKLTQTVDNILGIEKECIAKGTATEKDIEHLVLQISFFGVYNLMAGNIVDASNFIAVHVIAIAMLMGNKSFANGGKTGKYAGNTNAWYRQAVEYLKNTYKIEPNDIGISEDAAIVDAAFNNNESPSEFIDDLADKYDLDKFSYGPYGLANGGHIWQYPDLSKIKTPVIAEKGANLFTVPEIDIKKLGVVQIEGTKKIDDTFTAVEIFKDYWDKDKIGAVEEMAILFLNQQNVVTGIYKHSSGGITATTADVEVITAMAVKSLSKGIIICHNHPSGNLKASASDIALTNELNQALSYFRILLLDSLIITPDGAFTSIKGESSFANGGRTTAAINKDRRFINQNQPWEVNRIRKTLGRRYMAFGGMVKHVEKNMERLAMHYLPEITKDDVVEVFDLTQPGEYKVDKDTAGDGSKIYIVELYCGDYYSEVEKRAESEGYEKFAAFAESIANEKNSNVEVSWGNNDNCLTFTFSDLSGDAGRGNYEKGGKIKLGAKKVIENSGKQMAVLCSSVGNPDWNQNPNAPISPEMFYAVNNLKEAAAKCMQYISDYDLGGGNWAGGQVYCKEGNIVAEVSYNGRVWHPGTYGQHLKEFTGEDLNVSIFCDGGKVMAKGGDLKTTELFYPGKKSDITNKPVILYRSKKEAEHEAKEIGSGDVSSVTVGFQKLADDTVVEEIIAKNNFKSKADGWDTAELNIYELIDSRVDNSLSDGDLKKLFAELKSNGYTGIEFSGMNINTGEPDAECILIFEPLKKMENGGRTKAAFNNDHNHLSKEPHELEYVRQTGAKRHGYKKAAGGGATEEKYPLIEQRRLIAIAMSNPAKKDAVIKELEEYRDSYAETSAKNSNAKLFGQSYHWYKVEYQKAIDFVKKYKQPLPKIKKTIKKK